MLPCGTTMSPRPPHAMVLYLLRVLPDAAPATVTAARAKLDALPLPDRLEVALQLLEAMDARHGVGTGRLALAIVVAFGDAQALARLRVARPRLPAINALRDWRWEADAAIDALAGALAGQCPCTRALAPGEGPDTSIFEALEARHEDGVLVTSYVCRRCSAGLVIERDDSYHYPTYTLRSRTGPTRSCPA